MSFNSQGFNFFNSQKYIPQTKLIIHIFFDKIHFIFNSPYFI